ncbi:hypothetical protein HZ989_08070 [Brevundimonas sp. AJA228-03]|uniref:hypothetical protein n=1 Tax=Brevundimonas sp. AJA228-03 TaxID=2752515 RepID=UPI001ADF17E6|nr:hypothetical protein [Brevundimonas sp. AJA228-03]QTN18249.1 hypothetical protein HZ989_08070 [Brevundimonas sp. AJA228-03]
MTDIQSNPTIDDIVEDVDRERARPDGSGDRWSEGGETRSFARDQGLRDAVRSDIESGRDWARRQAARARGRIEEEPLKATLYALGIGVLIGVLLRR